MNKKIKLILLGVIIAIIGIRVYILVQKDTELEDIKRDVDIVEFEKDAQLDEPPTSDFYGHETGNGALIHLSNRTEFLQNVKDLDYGISVVNALGEALNYLHYISEYKGDSLEEYYDKNKEVINALYGIKDIDTFTKFYGDLDNDKITSCKIIIETLEEDNDLYKFDIELSGNKKVIIPVKVLAKKDENMIGRVYLYN